MNLIGACFKCRKAFPSHALVSINELGKCCFCGASLKELKKEDSQKSLDFNVSKKVKKDKYLQVDKYKR